MAQQANMRVVNGINTRMLHNKDYVEVSERTNILHRLRKSGEIKTFEMIKSEPFEVGARLVWIVSAKIDGMLYIGNAEVKLDAPKNSPDGTNPMECAETSAFGRMLAFAGLGTVESIASYDEVMRGQPFTAVIEQPQNRVVEAGNAPRQLPPPQELTLEQLKALCDELYGIGKWEKVRSRVLPPEEVGDISDDLLSQAQKAKIHAALIQRQKAVKATATSGK